MRTTTLGGSLGRRAANMALPHAYTSRLRTACIYVFAGVREIRTRRVRHGRHGRGGLREVPRGHEGPRRLVAEHAEHPLQARDHGAVRRELEHEKLWTDGCLLP